MAYGRFRFFFIWLIGVDLETLGCITMVTILELLELSQRRIKDLIHTSRLLQDFDLEFAMREMIHLKGLA